MGSFRSIFCQILVVLAIMCLPAAAQSAASGSLKQQLAAKYAITKATAARDDIVSAGDVVVLQKDKLLMWATTNVYPPQNTYKGGKIQQGAMSRFAAIQVPNGTSNTVTRTYVAGEKFWITGIDQKDDGVLFTVMSDPVGDTRFYGTVKFPFPKGSPPTPDQMLATVGEVFSVQGADNAPAGKSGGTQSAASQPPAAPAAAPAATTAPMAAIAPPPPPADAPPAAPPTIALGQTKDQVTATFGAPTRILDKGLTKVYVYPDMKVTFTRDKVTDIK